MTTAFSTDTASPQMGRSRLTLPDDVRALLFIYSLANPALDEVPARQLLKFCVIASKPSREFSSTTYKRCLSVVLGLPESRLQVSECVS